MADETEPRREPLEGLSEEVKRRRQDRSDDLFEKAFEDMSTEPIDADSVWEQLADDPESASDDADSEPNAHVPDRDVRVIDKRAFCQSCRYFASPPEMSCTHEGTAILELIDTGRVQVADCPIVAESDRLTDMGPGAFEGEASGSDTSDPDA